MTNPADNHNDFGNDFDRDFNADDIGDDLDRDEHRRLIEAIDQPSKVSDELDQMLADSPAAFLGLVSRTIMTCTICADMYIAEIGPTAPRSLRAIATAASYLQARGSVDIIGIDLPTWLARLDDSHITQARHRTEPTGTSSWLVEAQLASDHRISACLMLEPRMGALDGAMVIDGPIDDLEILARALEPAGAPPFRAADLTAAAARLVDGLGRYRATVGDPRPGDAWPGNEPLVTWFIATLLSQADPRRRGAAAA